MAHYQLIQPFFSDRCNLAYEISGNISRRAQFIMNELKAHKNSTLSLTSAIENQKQNIFYNFIYHRKGGKNIYGTTFENLIKNYEEWEASLENNYELIEISNSDVIPFWNLLPNEINTEYNRKKLKSYYKEYTERFSMLPKTMADEYEKYKDETIVFRFNNIDKRRRYSLYEGVITDDDYLENEVYDTVTIKDRRFNLKFLELMGYKNIKVSMTHDVSEIYDGWQYCALFDSKLKSDSIISEKYKDHGYHTTITDYANKEIIFDTFDIKRLKNDPKFYIRYRGSGYGRDDWKNKNVCVKVELSK